VRVLVVGTGFGARVVAPVFAATNGCEVIDVVSARDDVGAAIRAHRPDLVSVHSPPFLHAEHVRAALDAGVTVLCDKPCTPSAPTTEALLRHAEASGVLHLMNFEFRCEPARVEVARQLRDEMVGRVQRVTWVHHSAGTTSPLRPFGWLFDRELGGGWIGAWASHAVDTLRWWFGDPLVVISSQPRTDVVRRRDENGAWRACTAEDGLIAELRTANGAEVHLDSTFAAAQSQPSRITLRGEAGEIENIGDHVVHTRTTRGDATRDFRGDANADRHRRAMQRWAEVVRDSVLAGAAIPGAPTLHDGLECDRVLDALRVG
jgi:predicted dehydrogenase